MKDNYYSHLPKQSKFNTNNSQTPVVLLSPLDWGLGHATRCIPIVNHLLSIGCEVIIAAEGPQKTLLEQEFPLIQFVDIKGYRLSYGKRKWTTIFKILASIPKILTAINRERKWVEVFVERNKIDLVISDNRYGFASSKVPSVFITHQLLIRSPFGKRSETWLQKKNYQFINTFDACWVPDYEETPGLAGDLSHPAIKPAIPISYLGPVSRFIQRSSEGKGQGVLVLISGPEPQRTLFEEKILSQVSGISQAITIIRGVPGVKDQNQSPRKGITIHHHLPKDKLNQLVAESSIIISRPGYSTIMDLLPLGKRCIFIPTPGQSEQEYLAESLTNRGYCLSFLQEAFSLPAALEKMEHTKLKKFPAQEKQFEGVIQKSLNSLFSGSAV